MNQLVPISSPTLPALVAAVSERVSADCVLARNSKPENN